MKNLIASIIIIMVIPLKGFSFQLTTTDSLINNHVNATKDICRQLIKLNEKIAKINSTTDTTIIKELRNLEFDFSRLENNYKIIEEKLKDAEGEINEEQSIWQRALPQIIGALIGVGSAILAFLLGMWWDKRKKRKQEEKEVREKNEYLGSLLQASINLAKKQKDGIKEFYEKIDTNPLEIPLIAIHPKQDLERLSSVIDKEKYFHAFLNKYGSKLENVKLYRGIAGSVDFLNSQINQMFDTQDKGQKFDYERKMRYKALFDEARDLSAELGKQCQHTNPQLHNFIGSVLLNYYNGLNNSNSFDLKYHQDNLVTPLTQGFVQNFIAIPEVSEITNQLKNATLIYSEIIAQNQNHSNSFKEFHSYIEQAINSLEKNGTELTKDFKE